MNVTVSGILLSKFWFSHIILYYTLDICEPPSCDKVVHRVIMVVAKYER